MSLQQQSSQFFESATTQDEHRHGGSSGDTAVTVAAPPKPWDDVNTSPDPVKYPRYVKLKKYVINLDSRPDRLESTRRFFGDNFIRVSAVNGDAISYDEIVERFDMRKCNRLYLGNQTPREVSCVLSHYDVYRQVVNDDSIDHHDWVLVCEDDNYYDRDFAPKLDQLLQFLEQKRFEQAQIVVLKHGINEEIVDYLDCLRVLPRKAYFPAKDVPENGFANYTKAKHEYLCKDIEFNTLVRCENNNVFGFEYQGVREPVNPEMYGNRQQVFAPSFVHPRSAALYLIRKRTCRRIMKNHPRAFWFADDFKQLVPLQAILFISPYLAYDPPADTDISQSCINVSHSNIMHQFNRIHRERNRFVYRLARTYALFSSWYYSESKVKRKVSRFCVKMLHKILRIKY